MPDSTTHADTRLTAALTAFGFDGPAEHLHAHAPVLRVRDGRGDWVLKQSGMVHSAAEPIARWLRHLRARGVSTVVAADGFGANPRLLADGRHWVVYPFIPGEPYTASPAQIEASGALLAHMHVAGAFNDWGLRAYLRAPMREHAWIDRHAAAACAVMRADGIDDGPFRANLAMRRDAAGLGGLPVCGCSFDFKAANLVFSPEPVLIDPDHAAYLPRIYDLAIAALLFHDDRASAPPRLFTRPEWRAFLAGYGRTVVLDAAERAAWPDALRLAWLDQAVWLLGNAGTGWRQPRERSFLQALATDSLDSLAIAA